MNVFHLIWNKFIKCSECLFLSSVEWKCQIDYVLHVVQCGLGMTACVGKWDQDRVKGSGWEKAGVCECTGGWRTVLTGDSWWGIIRICTSATKHPSPADETDTVHSTPLWILQCGILQIISTHTKSNVWVPFLPHHSLKPPHLLLKQWLTGCFRRVSLCVRTYSPWVRVCVCRVETLTFLPLSQLSNRVPLRWHLNRNQCVLPLPSVTPPFWLHPGQTSRPYYTPSSSTSPYSCIPY